jgi:hypothetical protein
MKIGMLWFDNNPTRTLAQKIEEAAAYYQKKYGTTPNLAFVHPWMQTPGSSNNVDGIEVKTSKSILPNHIWIGIGE